LRRTIGDLLDNLVNNGGDRRPLAAAGLMRG
jgi:hypothetical protein